MSRRRHTPEQVVRKLREADRLLGEGSELPEVTKHLEIVRSRRTYRWRNQFGGMKADDVKRLKELEAENARLKRIVADQALDIQGLKELRAGKLLSPARRRRAVLRCRSGLGSPSVGRVVWRVSIGPPNVTAGRRGRMTRRCGSQLRVFSRRGRGGGIARRISICSSRAGDQSQAVQRLWREEGLRVPQKRRKRRGAGNRRSRGPAAGTSDPITCGRLTFSST